MALSPIFLECGGGIVAIGGVITGVGADVTLPAGARALSSEGAFARPGFVNAHTHLYSGLAPLGMPEPSVPPRSFVEILERIWWRLDRALDEASLRAAAELYVAEALLAGTTTIVDHHESPSFIEGSLDVLADAAQGLGCRLVTCYGATDRNGGPGEGSRGLRECARFVRENRRSLVRGAVGLHASFTVSDETARAAGELARGLGVPVHVHVAEDGADVDDARRRGHEGPLERLIALGALPPGSILAHGVWLSREEVQRASDEGLWLVHNPRSNAGNRVGYASALAPSERVALGTDGYPADMREEGDALIEEARKSGAPLRDTDRRARMDCGYAIAQERFGVRFGPRLVPGIAADAAVFACEEDARAPGARPSHVLVDGRVVVEGGQLVSGDLDAIRARAREQAPLLWERMERI